MGTLDNQPSNNYAAGICVIFIVSKIQDQPCELVKEITKSVK